MRPVLVALALIFALAPNASANWQDDRAQLIASTAWNHPCDAEIVWDPTLRDGVVATVRHDERPPYGCRVRLAPGAWELRDWMGLCSYMIHEFGHLAGVEHSQDEGSIMHEFFDDDPRCRDRGRPYLESAGVIRAARASIARASHARRAFRATQHRATRLQRRALRAARRRA